MKTNRHFDQQMASAIEQLRIENQILQRQINELKKFEKEVRIVLSGIHGEIYKLKGN